MPAEWPLFASCVGLAVVGGLFNSILTHHGFRKAQHDSKKSDWGWGQDILVALLGGIIAYAWFAPSDFRQSTIGILAGISPNWLWNTIKSQGQLAKSKENLEVINSEADAYKDILLKLIEAQSRGKVDGRDKQGEGGNRG